MMHSNHSKVRSQNMKFVLFQPTTQKPFWWRSLFTLILCFVLPAASSAQLADTKIAFSSDRDSGEFIGEIYVMDASGNNPVNITNNPAADFRPAGSPAPPTTAAVSLKGKLATTWGKIKSRD